MVKKFTFNFSFLDRFKKKTVSPPPPPEDYRPEDNEDGDIHLNDEIKESDFNQFSRKITDDQILNKNDDEEIKLPEFNDDLEDNSNVLEEFQTPEKSEAFAEKTLSGFELPSELNIPEDKTGEFKINTNNNHDEFKYKFDSSDAIKNIPTTESVDENLIIPIQRPKFKFNIPRFGKKANDAEGVKKRNLKSSFQKMEKVSWNDFVLKIFSPYTRGRIHGTFLILFVIALTYLIGKTIATLTNRTTKIEIQSKSSIIIPSDQQDSAVTDINKITATNLFNAKEVEEAKPKGPQINIADIVCINADRPTSMPIKLLDTIVLQDSIKSVASVQIRGATELLNIREGEKIDNAEVSKIERMKLILKNLETGDCEYVRSENGESSLSSSPIKVISQAAGKSLFKSMNPNISNSGNNFKIKRKYRDEMITKMSEILTQAKAVQITNPDGSLCFKMTEIVAGSIYSSLNIQENDIICQMNGKKIDNLNDLMGTLGRIKEIDSMQIGLKRNGMQENLEYNFE